MCPIVTIDKECNLSLISVKKPYQACHGIYVFDITYDKQPLLIQTPICTIPYSYSIFDNNSFKIDVNTNMKAFATTLDKIHSHILNKIRCYDESMVKDKELVDYVKEVNDDEVRIRLRNTSTQNIMAFDRSSLLMPVSNIQSLDRVICLYQLQRVVVQKDLYMFGTCLCQIKRLNVGLKSSTNNTCLISTTDSVDRYGSIDLSKYNKMKQLGIPLEAIEHKMTMDGLKRECIKYWMDFQTLRLPSTVMDTKGGQPPKGPPLPPPPPPPPAQGLLITNVNSNNNKPKPPDFLKDIMSHNFRLKKATETKENKVVVGKLASKFKDDFGYEPPTLQDILNARSSLKKVSR